MLSNLWRAVKVEPTYYTFWGLLIVFLALAALGIAGPVWYELHKIRKLLEAAAVVASPRR